MISFRRLPKADDTNARHGYTGADAEYVIERQGSFGYIIWIYGVYPLSADRDSLRGPRRPVARHTAENLAEAKGFVEAYDQSSEILGSHSRWQDGNQGGYVAWAERFEAQEAKKAQEFAAFQAQLDADLAEIGIRLSR